MEELAPDQRLQEIATIFARAILRLRLQQEPPESSEVSLELPAKPSVTVHRG
jgi:hypothetical protein